jgi:hypothetical protein
MVHDMDYSSQSSLSSHEPGFSDEDSDLRQNGKNTQPRMTDSGLPTPNGSSDSEGESSEAEVESKAMAARAYQLEMLEQSLKRNIIVAVSGEETLGDSDSVLLTNSRWILGAARHKCKAMSTNSHERISLAQTEVVYSQCCPSNSS